MEPLKINLAKAIIAVMKEVKGIEKSLTVGTGAMSYKGVSDQVVKQVIGASMEKHGLCILPIDIQSTERIDRWEETITYNNVPQVKQKQSIFTTATTKYLLLHESGESQVLSGYGHGVDSQDKSAGKATTYALKYVLLYTFLVPTGKIDDADTTHSDSIATPVKQAQKKEKKEIKIGTQEYKECVAWLNKNNGDIDKLCRNYIMTQEVKDALFAAWTPKHEQADTTEKMDVNH